MTAIAPLSPAELILETERLRLRPFVLTDMDLASEMFTDAEVMKYVNGALAPEEVPEETRKATRRGAGGRIGAWCVTDKKSHEKLGTAILLPLPIEATDTDWLSLREDVYPDAEIEVGYILKPAAWGKGFATEVCRRLLRFGFESTALPEIVAVTDPANAASQHVLTKCGFRREGTRRAYAAEVPAFRIAREDWTTLR